MELEAWNSAATLWADHVRGNTSSSTFRYVLASLLLEELALTPRLAASKVVLDRQDNARTRNVRACGQAAVTPKSLIRKPSGATDQARLARLNRCSPSRRRHRAVSLSCQNGTVEAETLD
jgi:hypothetical protein